MAFGAQELRVLRRALALALHPTPASAEDAQDCLRLTESLDEAMREGARLRAFLVADLARYRAALPGTAAGYLALLEEALGAGYRPDPDDLAALRALRGNPVAAALLDRCPTPAEKARRAVRACAAPRHTVPAATPTIPASRTRLLALPGGRPATPHGPVGPVGQEGEPQRPKRREPPEQPERPKRPAAPKPSGPARPKPARPVPTPGEVFPRRKPGTPPPASPPQQLAAG